jgi:hypothetical protein
LPSESGMTTGQPRSALAKTQSWIVLAILTVAGCGLSGKSLIDDAGSTGGSGGTVNTGSTGGSGGTADAGAAGMPASCASQTPATPPPSGDVVADMAVAQSSTYLDQFLGRYLRGDVPTYSGTASADDSSALLGARLSFSSTSAVAALTFDADWAILTVASPSDHLRFTLQQQSTSPGLTYGGNIFPDNTFGTGPGSATCTDCVPDLFTQPPSLAWDGLDASFAGTFFPDGEVSEAPFDVTSSASLQVQSPCALTWEQVSALNGGPRGFQRIGSEMVFTYAGSVQTIAPSFRMCDGQSVSYAIDLYVNLANLFDYGVRNYVAQPPNVICGGA